MTGTSSCVCSSDVLYCYVDMQPASCMSYLVPRACLGWSWAVSPMLSFGVCSNPLRDLLGCLDGMYHVSVCGRVLGSEQDTWLVGVSSAAVLRPCCCAGLAVLAAQRLVLISLM